MKACTYEQMYMDRLFTEPFEDTREEQIELLRSRTLKKYRLKTIISGDILESEGYPIWNTKKPGLKAKAIELKKSSRPEQVALNRRNTQKKIVRLINGNFTKNDIWITVGYCDEDLPSTKEEAHRNLTNYIRRLQRYCVKHELPKLKYVYVTEYSKETRVHHHLVLNFPDRDVAEKMWKKGEYPQARRLQPNDYGLTGLASYISKDPKGSKSYGYSLNLHKSWIKPFAKTADSKLSKRKAAKIAMGELEPKVYYENLYKGYELLDLEVRTSSYSGGCYLYARMKKRRE